MSERTVWAQARAVMDAEGTTYVACEDVSDFLLVLASSYRMEGEEFAADICEDIARQVAD